MTPVYIVLGIVAVALVAFVLGRGSSSGDFTSTPNDLTDADVHDLIQKGRKIEAIKAYRAVHGVGLKEAKEAVEKITDLLTLDP